MGEGGPTFKHRAKKDTKTMALYSVFDMQVKIAGNIVLITKFRLAQIKLCISCNGTN